MASVLGRVTRWVFQHSISDSQMPWDSRSEFSRLAGILVNFESYSEADNVDLAEILGRDYAPDGNVSCQAACHFIYSHVLYHLNQCLLHHPFLLRQNLKFYSAKIPSSFLREALRKSKDHALQLSSILRCLQDISMKAIPSFFGYAATIVGVILRLHS